MLNLEVTHILFFAGLLNNSPLTCTLAVRTIPSCPGWTASIRPVAHRRGGWLSSFRTTSLPTPNLFDPEDFHLVYCCRWLRYSLYHCFQKCCFSCSTYYQWDGSDSSRLDAIYLALATRWGSFQWGTDWELELKI